MALIVRKPQISLFAVRRRYSLPKSEVLPAQPCLSSRFPPEPVTTAALATIKRAEVELRSLGYGVFCVGQMEASRLRAQWRLRLTDCRTARATLPNRFGTRRRLGYGEVRIDPRGYRRGSPSAAKFT
jgi:PP-loop superfamily ATP-utilizing enzyme